MSRDNTIEITTEGEQKPRVQIEVSTADSLYIRIPRKLIDWLDKKLLGK